MSLTCPVGTAAEAFAFRASGFKQSHGMVTGTVVPGVLDIANRPQSEVLVVHFNSVQGSRHRV